jgi:hypothetical protein
MENLAIRQSLRKVSMKRKETTNPLPKDAPEIKTNLYQQRKSRNRVPVPAFSLFL